MVFSSELQKVPRYEIILPLRVVSVGGRRVNLLGQTRDVGAGGVRFVVQDKLPIGRKVEYVITRSSGNRGTEIECVGNILRCVKKYDYPSYEVVASIENESKKRSWIPALFRKCSTIFRRHLTGHICLHRD